MGCIIDIDVLSEVVRHIQCHGGDEHNCLKEDIPKADRELIEQFMVLYVQLKQESEPRLGGDERAKDQ